MAIVLVIIGLIVGGVMVGQDLIKVAKLQGAVTDLDKLSASVNAFKLKYNCTPGDCPNALNYFPSSYVTYAGCTGNGNGNGLIDNWPCESAQAIASLEASGLMPFKPGPASGIATATIYFRGFNYSNAYFFYTDLYSQTSKVGNSITWAAYDSSTWVSGGAMTAGDALAVDQKLDDGYPITGAFLGMNSTTGGTWPAGTCVAPGTNTYTATPTLSIGCRALYFLQ